MFESWLQAFHPNSDDLLDRLFPLVDDRMLREIAEADYGRDVADHLAPLKAFRDDRVLPILEWHPAEVLELIRWSEPEDPRWKPGGHGRYGHLLRAFACTMLLRSYARDENRGRWNSFNETAIQLADSLRTLGEEFVSAGIRFLAWCVGTLGPIHDDKFERPFLSLALLSLSVNATEIPDRSIVDLCKEIDAEVQSLLPEYRWRATRKLDWLLSMNYHDLRNERWKRLGKDLVTWGNAERNKEKATWLALIGQALSEE